MGGISIWQLLIIVVIVVLVFGTKKFRTIGSDLGAALKGFKNAMSDDEKESKQDKSVQDADFTPKTLSENKPNDVKKDEKSHDKEQV